MTIPYFTFLTGHSSATPSECTSPNIRLVLLLPAPALYSWLLRRNVGRMVARIRAKIWLTSFEGRFSPARHHASLPSNLTKDCTRSSSLRSTTKRRCAPTLASLRWPLATPTPCSGRWLLTFHNIFKDVVG
jgi:hypothetical protein